MQSVTLTAEQREAAAEVSQSPFVRTSLIATVNQDANTTIIVGGAHGGMSDLRYRSSLPNDLSASNIHHETKQRPIIRKAHNSTSYESELSVEQRGAAETMFRIRSCHPASLSAEHERIRRAIFRFCSFLRVQEDDCWIWTGASAGGRTKDQRYGYFRPTLYRNHRENVYAHRFAYEVCIAEFSPGENGCHRCDRPLCVNPLHINAFCQKKNMEDAVARDRTTRGSRNGVAKLTEHDVRRIFARRSEGATQKDIAAEFGVSRTNVSMILSGKSWPHVHAVLSDR